MNKPTQTADAQTIAFYKRYTEELMERLSKAYEQIGGLQYYLEKNDIELPENLVEKKAMPPQWLWHSQIQTLKSCLAIFR